jgi:hypothetical protein
MPTLDWDIFKYKVFAHSRLLVSLLSSLTLSRRATSVPSQLGDCLFQESIRGGKLLHFSTRTVFPSSIFLLPTQSEATSAAASRSSPIQPQQSSLTCDDCSFPQLHRPAFTITTSDDSCHLAFIGSTISIPATLRHIHKVSFFPNNALVACTHTCTPLFALLERFSH